MHHYISLLSIVLGIFIVGLVNILYKEEKNSKGFIGIILILAAQCFAGAMFIVEEKLLGNYYLDPLYVVGWEGIWGFLMYVILLFIL